jgi:hypothetical protein
MSDSEKYVFISLADCGHAQSVYIDVPQTSGDSWDADIMGDLRAGLTVKRVPLKVYQDEYVKTFMCGCKDFSTGVTSAEK